MSTPPEATRHHILTQLLVLLHLRAIYFSTFQYETPCTWILIIEKAKYIESQGTNDKLGTPILKRIEYVYIHPMIWTIARPPQCM